MRIKVPNPSFYTDAIKVDGRSGEYSSKISYKTPTLAERGREHWRRFHTMELTPETLKEWERDIPSFGCDCASKYAKIEEANPPRFDDSFAWTVEVHNSVNADIVPPKRIVSLAEALSIWHPVA